MKAYAARFVYEKPEQLVDFTYRSQPETARTAKALIQAFYGRAAARSYFVGCSSGGYQGLMEAQRFPSDYDGVVATMPANCCVAGRSPPATASAALPMAS